MSESAMAYARIGAPNIDNESILAHEGGDTLKPFEREFGIGEQIRGYDNLEGPKSTRIQTAVVLGGPCSRQPRSIHGSSYL